MALPLVSPPTPPDLGLTRLGSFEIAEVISSQSEEPVVGVVVLEALASPGEVTRDLADDLRSLCERQVQIVQLNQGIRSLLGLVKAHTSDILVVQGLDELIDSELRRLDLLRSALSRKVATIFVVREDTFARMERLCPHWMTWTQATVFSLDHNAGILSPEEREEWLAELSQHFRLTNEQVIALAEKGEILPDPNFATWLSLLGRGDLLG